MPPLPKLEASTARLSFDGNALFPLPLYAHTCTHHPANSSDCLCAGHCAKAACSEGRPPVQPSWGSHANGNTVRKRVHRPIKSKNEETATGFSRFPKAEHSYETFHNPKWQKAEKQLLLHLYEIFLSVPRPKL